MEDDECRCQIELDRTPSLIPNSFKCQEKQLINFGTVQVGQKKWIKWDVRNIYNETIEYTVTRDPTINPLYHVFNFSTYKFNIPANRSLTIKISYKPLYSDTGDVDSFNLTNSKNEKVLICVQGIGFGPKIQISKSFLRFNTWDAKPTERNTVEIKNESEMNAMLHFDIDTNDPVFQMDKHKFSIAGNGYTYLKIKFTPVNYGVYQRRIVCLILHHDPIVLELFGVHSTKESILEDYVLISCPQKRRTRGNYYTYMEDVQMIMEEDPLFSLTETYIDFGRVSLNNNYGIISEKSKTITTSMTNHMRGNIFVKFEEDPIFSIKPSQILIPPSESALFECVFTPDKPDCIFNKKHSGSVFWKDERMLSDLFSRLKLPLPFEITFLGHSFCENSFWLPQLDIIPEVIVLPPTVPGKPSFYTFQLKCGGRFPVGFKFLPPNKTKFIIKPMLGLVTNYRLLVVQLQSDTRQQKSKVHVEKWSVILNDRSDHLLHFYLKGISEMPELIVGDQNRVKFGCVQTGCTEKLAVPMKNNCQHRLSYKFLTHEIDYLQITNPVGELAPNETIRLDWFYHSSSNICVKYTIVCLIHVLEKMHGIFGSPFEIPIEVYTESYISELCCIPSYYNLGIIEGQKLQVVLVSLQNFGPSILHYLLETVEPDNVSEININGAIGTVNPGESTDIFVEFTPKTVGEYVISVIYKIRKSADSPEVMPNSEKALFKINYTSLYPYIQVVDIMHHNFGQLFPKHALWDLFDIDNLNNALRLARYDSTNEIEIRTPDNQISQEDFFVYFLLKNITPFNLDVELKRRKVCDCPLITAGGSVSLRKKFYACYHKDMFSINLDTKLIQANAVQLLKVNIRYILEGSNLMSYEMFFTSNRRFILNFTIKSLADSESILSIYSPKFKFHLSPVCLSENNPQIQGFWFYNNTDKEVEYSIDLEEIDNVNVVYEYQILNCLNPEGVIESYSRMPLLFKFVPIKRKTFSVILPLRMGNEETVFLLSGDGTKSFKGYIKAAEKIGSYNMMFEVPIQLSEYYLQLSPMPVWSSSSSIIFIRNSSRNSVIGYSWRGYGIDGMFEAKMKPRKGVLSPGDSHLAMLEVKSFGEPCKLRFLIVCKLLNHNEYYLHKKSLTAYNCKQEQIKDEFTITEKGITYPVNDVYVHPFPKQFYTSFTVDIIVSSTPDRDIHYTPQEQLTHTPTYMLPVADATLNVSLEFPHASQESIYTIYTFLEKIEETNRSKTRPCVGGRPPVESSSEEEIQVEENSEFDEEHIDFFKDALECIIADTIFSTLFLDTLKMRRLEAPIYYEQVRNKNGENTNTEKAIQKFFIQPPIPTVTYMFQDMLLESLKAVFETDLQSKQFSNEDILGEIEKCIAE